MRRIWFFGVLAAAIGAGIFIAWVDSRPTWDDTGITAGAILLSTALCGALFPSRAWVWALAVGVWVPLTGIILHHSYSTLLVLVIALLGAYGGALARRLLASGNPSSPH